ncbi:MAG: hypothetical protein ACRCWQ_11035 [Bacilli bacterium]
MRKTIEQIYQSKKGTMYFERIGWDEENYRRIVNKKNITMDCVIDTLIEQKILNVSSVDITVIMQNLKRYSRFQDKYVFAEQCDIQYSTMNKILSGRRGVGILMFEKICENLGLEPLQVLKQNGKIATGYEKERKNVN